MDYACCINSKDKDYIDNNFQLLLSKVITEKVYDCCKFVPQPGQNL